MDQTTAESSATAAARLVKTALKSKLETIPESVPAQDTSEKPKQEPTEDLADEAWSEARIFSRYKLRSMETLRDAQLSKVSGACQAISAVLLGDSMIERMTTTGNNKSLHLWPSETMYSETDLEATNLRRRALRLPGIVRISGMLNAGCSGDKIENVIYRLVGDPERGLTGLSEALSSPKRQRKVKLWVVHAGTNNLHPKKGLTDASVQAFRVLLETVLDISDESTHILVTGLFYRKDIKNKLVDQANAKLKKLVHGLSRDISPYYPESEQLSVEEGTSQVDSAIITDAGQVTDVKGKGKEVVPEERRDSAIELVITPAVTREDVKLKGEGKGKEKEIPTGTQELMAPKTKRSPPFTGRDPTMPQFKPNWWPSVFEKDPEAVGMPW